MTRNELMDMKCAPGGRDALELVHMTFDVTFVVTTVINIFSSWFLMPCSFGWSHFDLLVVVLTLGGLTPILAFYVETMRTIKSLLVLHLIGNVCEHKCKCIFHAMSKSVITVTYGEMCPAINPNTPCSPFIHPLC